MCRSIKTLYNYAPPAGEDDIEAASLQFVRKISGYRSPSKVNELAFNKAIAEVNQAVETLLSSLQTQAPPKKRL